MLLHMLCKERLRDETFATFSTYKRCGWFLRYGKTRFVCQVIVKFIKLVFIGYCFKFKMFCFGMQVLLPTFSSYKMHIVPFILKAIMNMYSIGISIRHMSVLSMQMVSVFCALQTILHSCLQPWHHSEVDLPLGQSGKVHGMLHLQQSKSHDHPDQPK